MTKQTNQFYYGYTPRKERVRVERSFLVSEDIHSMMFSRKLVGSKRYLGRVIFITMKFQLNGLNSFCFDSKVYLT